MSDLELIASLQRELAEARRLLKLVVTDRGFRDSGGILIDWVERFLAPGPSDAKGDHIAEPTKLVPLTDPTVRGVLVDDGEPRDAWVDGAFIRNFQPQKIRPASEFGVDGGERIKELESEAERLRKAIETHKAEVMETPHKPGPANTKLWSALTTPTAASGETPVVCDKCGTELIPDERDGQVGVYGPCTDCGDNTPIAGRVDKPFHRPECQCDRCKLWIHENPLPPSAPAAESEGDGESHWETALRNCAKHLCESAKTDYLESNPCFSLTAAMIVLVDRSARLAACEERCRELEAGIEFHRITQWSAVSPSDKALWSMLATKAGGEDAVV